jgi:heme-degrading monooxygenase HmoA
MIVMFSARRLKPGAWEQFRQAWEGDESDRPPGLQQVIHARNIRDEDEVISFGIFDMSEADYRGWREQHDPEENKRMDALSAFVENDHVSGAYEVIEQLTE